MPISKIKGGAINDDAISTAKIVDDAVTSPKIVDSYTTALQTNPEFSGTEAARMPVGTTAQRASAQAGDLRFNSTISLMEYYDGSNWKIIDTPPNISSVTPDNFDAASDTITINGSFFDLSATVKVIANDGTEFTPSTVTNVSASQITFDITQAMVDDNDDPYDVKVSNPSGQTHTLNNALDFAPNPVFTVAAGSLATIYDAARSGYGNITTGATSAESDATLTYAITSGSLPSGLSFSSSTGTISGTAGAVGSNTTSNFTITATATDSDGNTTTNSRAYSITVAAPTVTSFTSAGTGTWSVPRGISSVEALVVGGGGGGAYGGPANDGSGGGGGGGLVHYNSFPVTPEGTVAYQVGEIGWGGQHPNSPSLNFDTTASSIPSANNWKTWRSNHPSNYGGRGGNSKFGTINAIGGGGGGYTNNPSDVGPGGSGGGAGGGGANQSSYGQALQPSEPNSGSDYNLGNNGGDNGTGQPYTGSGGGGANGAGAGANGSTNPGGPGATFSISGSSVYYSAGGGGGYGTAPPGHPSGTSGGNAGVGGHGHGGASPNQGSQNNGANGYPSSQGVSNKGHGGGGGGGGNNPQGTGYGGLGDRGVVIIKY
jgi:hypothetical protein